MMRTSGKIKETLCSGYRDNYQPELERRQLIKYLRTEFSNCVPYVVNKEVHWIERVFWTLSYLTCVGTVFLLLSWQLFRFYEAPIVMSVEKDYFNWNVSYPAFTVCPYLKPDEELYNAFVNDTNNRMSRNLEPYISAIIHVSLDNLNVVKTISPDIAKLIHPSEYANIAALTFRTVESSALTTNTNWPVQLQPAMTELGMCHVINSNVAYLDNPLVDWCGHPLSCDSSLWGSKQRPYVHNSIVLSVHDRDFFAQVANYANAYKVFIHSPDNAILSSSPYSRNSDQGFHQFGVEVWSTKISDMLKRSPTRFRKCRFIDENISERYPVYSYTHCMLECRIKMIIRLCGCIPHFYKPLPHEKICYIEELKCVLRYKREILTLSASARTLKLFRNSKEIPAHPRDCGCLNSCETDVYKKDIETFLQQSHFNRLRIGISRFPKVRVVRDIIFNLEDIILKVGGAVNLCIGASIISMAEFSLAFLRIPVYRIYKAIRSALILKRRANRVEK